MTPWAYAPHLRPLISLAAKSQIMGLCTGQHIGDASPTNHKEQGEGLFNHCCTVGECNFIGRNHPERISADKERFRITRPFQQVLSALILFCGLAFINHPVLVMSSTRGLSLASKEIDRKKCLQKRNHLRSTSAHHRIYPALHRTWQEMWTSNKLRKKSKVKKWSGYLNVSTQSLSFHSFSLHPCCCRCPEQNDPSAFALVRRLEGTKRKFLR